MEEQTQDNENVLSVPRPQPCPHLLYDTPDTPNIHFATLIVRRVFVEHFWSSPKDAVPYNQPVRGQVFDWFWKKKIGDFTLAPNIHEDVLGFQILKPYICGITKEIFY